MTVGRSGVREGLAMMRPVGRAPTAEPPTVVVLKRGEEDRLRRGHPWIFSSEVARVKGPAEPGCLARLHASSGEDLGLGHYNPRSKIAFRFLAREGPVDRAFFLGRLRRALERREKLFPGDTAYRLCFGESDDLPGLVVDRYGPYLAVQVLSAGMDRAYPLIESALVELLHPEGILLKNDSDFRRLEGLPLEVRVALGAVPPRVEIREGDLRFLVSIGSGQKTGFYFDQRQNRSFLVPYFEGLRVVDLYCYVGAFALRAARSGARSVVGIDSSAPAVDLARENAVLNGLEERARFEEGNAVSFLREADRRPPASLPDMILLDPPNFAPARADLVRARRAYARLFAKGLRALRPGGWLAVSTCSRHVTAEVFRGLLREAAQLSRRNVDPVAFRIQSEDHPVHPAMPETEYLRFALLRVAG